MNYSKIGKLDGRSIYRKGGQLYKEMEHKYLFELSDQERREFMDQRVKFSIKGGKQ